ncbi:MAG: hypothetical protein Q8O67_15935 [Deltaproteobacteria bacterium]|nr:hypothetical protein [Deltaproteobacteria bacterium]
MTTTRGLGSTTQYNGGSARWEGTEDKQRTVSIKDLPLESQAAHEILKLLRECDPKGRTRLLEVARQKDPVTQQGLAGVAALFQRLEMPLNPAGIQRFKADRGLGGGTSLNPACAKAYARAVNGGEVLFRVDRGEEANLRPADKACLGFLRTWSRSHGAEAVGRLKEALDLGNPEVGADAAALANEYVGVNTVREVSKASSMRNCPLTPEGMDALSTQLEAEKAKATAATAATATRLTRPASNASASAVSPTAATQTRLTRPPSSASPTISPTTTTTLTRPPSKAGAAPSQTTSVATRMPAGPVTSMAPRPKK